MCSLTLEAHKIKLDSTAQGGGDAFLALVEVGPEAPVDLCMAEILKFSAARDSGVSVT